MDFLSMEAVQTAILYSSLFISLFFEVFLLITYLEIRDILKFEDMHVGKNLSRFPKVTVIVPCFNEELTVGATIDSILDLDYPKENLSIMLVDDGSTDGTPSVLLKYRDNQQVKIFSKENGGKHTALNFALQSVETELVGCLDADSFVDREALKKIVPYFDDALTMAVTPAIRIHEPKTVLQCAQRIEYTCSIFLRRMLSSIGALYVTPGPFSIFRTRVFRELGGYKHAHHTEDMEMAMRLQKNGYKIVNSHGARVHTMAPAKLGALYKQRVRWAYGFLNNAIDYREFFFNRKYGHIGLFIMPVATISIFVILYNAGSALWTGFSKVAEAVARYQAVGFQWKYPTLSLDWFFLNTGVAPMLALAVIALSIVIVVASMMIADGKVKIRKDLFYYLTLYVFIIPAWLAKAVWSTIMGRKISWR